MNLSLDLRLGSGGGGASFTNPAIPAIDNIVRCWSLRRNVPAYKNGAGIRELSASGGSENDVMFLNSGLLSITGADAFANVIYDQKGNADSKLVQSTFDNCPKVFESNAMLKGFFASRGNIYLSMNPDYTDTAIASMFAGDFSISAWCSTTSGAYAERTIFGYGHPTHGYYQLAWYNGKLSAFVGNTSRTIISTNQFFKVGSDYPYVHVVLTKTGGVGTVGGVKLYVNGSPAANPVNVPSITPDTTFSPSTLAMSDGTGDGNASVNDIILYNTDLSADQVAVLYTVQAPYYAGGGAK